MSAQGRERLLAIPPEAASEEMTRFVRIGTGLFMTGGGATDYFCGHCGRLLLLRVAPHSVLDVWFTCPKCQWLNGMDISLGWAKYVVEQLEQRKLTLERIEQLIDDLRSFDGTVDGFVERNSDVGPVLGWLSKLSPATIIAILTLLYMVYAQQQNLEAAKEGLSVVRQQLTVAQKGAVPDSLSPQQILEIAEALHRLQGEIQTKRPPPPPSKVRARSSKR